MPFPRKYELTRERRQILLTSYIGKKEVIDKICTLSQFAGVPRYRIRRWAQDLGLARPVKRPWTDKDDSDLERYLPIFTVQTIAAKLKRSRSDVAQRARLLNITKLSEGYTQRSLAEAFGCSDDTIHVWINKGWLKAAQRNTAKERDLYYITERDVRNFIARHPQEVNQHTVCWEWIVDILVGQGLGRVSK